MFIVANTASSVFELVEYFEMVFYQVHGSRVFSDLVTYLLLIYPNSNSNVFNIHFVSSLLCTIFTVPLEQIIHY